MTLKENSVSKILISRYMEKEKRDREKKWL